MTEAGVAAQQASNALWRAREAIRQLGDRSCAEVARRDLADAVFDLRLAGVAVDDVAACLSLSERAVRRLLVRRVV